MYWCKIARSKKEFDEIAKLNYTTFVEEIPQHEAHESAMRVDPYHEQNTYLIVLSDKELVGMIAVRSDRPFSLDRKIGQVEVHLDNPGKLCEIRLLAVRKEHRNGRVFFLLARALSDYCCEEGFDAAVISGTVRELKLYGQLGFSQFAEPVGSGDAVFIPMITTRADYAESVAARLQAKRRLFLPGPLKLTEELGRPFTEEAMSHRSSTFQAIYQEVKEKLRVMSGAFPYLLSGSGTLANEAMVAQLSRLKERGLILSNGEFGERLIRQATRWQLEFDSEENQWGESFSMDSIQELMGSGKYGWLLMVHGETSTGMVNDFEAIRELCEEYNIKLCVDCISSFGAIPFSMEACWLATATSGKAVGTMSGLAVVFSDHEITADYSLPSYLDLGMYQHDIPFTLPYSLLKSFGIALKQYPERYQLLQERFEYVKGEIGTWPLMAEGFPTAITIRSIEQFADFPQDAHLSGYELHAQSGYLRRRGIFQISCIQPGFEKDWAALQKFYTIYFAYQKE